MMTQCSFFSVNCPFKSPYTSAAVQYVQTSCLKSGQRGVFIEACTLYFLFMSFLCRPRVEFLRL